MQYVMSIAIGALIGWAVVQIPFWIWRRARRLAPAGTPVTFSYFPGDVLHGRYVKPAHHPRLHYVACTEMGYEVVVDIREDHLLVQAP